RFNLGGARALQAIILHLHDRHADAESIADETVRSNLQHHRGVLSTLLTYQANGALACGDARRALELAAQALGLAEPLGDYLRVGSARSVLAQITAATGDLAGAADVIEPVLRMVEGVEDEVFIPFLDQAMATLELHRGDHRAAIIWLRRAAHSTDRGTATWIAGRALPGLGAALAATGSHDDARAVLGSAVAVAKRLGLPGPLAEAFAAQAELAATDPDGLPHAIDLHHKALTIRVDRHLRAAQPDSLEALARHGTALRPTVDDVRSLYSGQAARDVMGLHRTPEQQRAFDTTATLLRQALGEGTFDEAAADGARLPLDQAVSHSRRARGRRGRPTAGWSSLTPTELDVVRLVAAGLTNPQISARLRMSRGTVKTHLSHIFTKLDTSNRTELASAAADRGLSRPGEPDNAGQAPQARVKAARGGPSAPRSS
ncbi:MAG TPA: LuxR C-terminal-related transcriptional regulator, partial [Mycobacterium sp.]|nr:LuxR C-terminal-related transcriptional regulator [Mycobacterium sp.]